MDKHLPANTGDTGLIPGLGRSYVPQATKLVCQDHGACVLKLLEPPCPEHGRCNKEPPLWGSLCLQQRPSTVKKQQQFKAISVIKTV